MSLRQRALLALSVSLVVHGALWGALPASASNDSDSRFPAFSSEELGTLIQAKRLLDVPSVVRAIPEYVRGNMSIVYESNSAQPAHVVLVDVAGKQRSGVETPRILLWDSQARFFMTYNGDSASLGFNTIETLDYQDSSAIPRFVYQGTEFPSAANPHIAPVPTQSCLSCHGNLPNGSRPIWGEYPKWDGVYGSVEDIIQPSEAPNYARFRANAETDDLYQFLFPTDAWVNYPLKKDANIDVESESHTFRYRPNTRMSILLNRLNARRIFAILKSQARYRADRAKLAYAFLGCGEDTAGATLLASYGLSARDLDMRYSYTDPKYEQMAFSDSYFDGAATLNELLAASILADLVTEMPQLKPSIEPRTLTNLYHETYHRLEDLDFMAGADELGIWIKTPFPAWQLKGKFRPKPTSLEADDVKQLCGMLSGN